MPDRDHSQDRGLDQAINLKVTFADGNHLHTRFNGSLADAEKYYVGQEFQHGDTDAHPGDKLVKAIKVEEIKPDQGHREQPDLGATASISRLARPQGAQAPGAESLEVFKERMGETPLIGFTSGKLAWEYGRMRLPLQVMRSAAGYYLGTADVDGAPYSRESQEYFPSHDAAAGAMASGQWTQRENP